MKRLLVLLLCFLLLSGCTEPPVQPDLVVFPEDEPSPTAPPDISLPVGPAKSNVFSLAWIPVTELSPFKRQFNYNEDILKLCYESLFELDELLEPQPLLCAGITEEDNLHFTLSLRPNVTFHDGSPLTAKDVVYSFECAKRPDSAYSSNLSDFSSFSAVDELTVEVYLSSPAFRYTSLLDFPIIPDGSVSNKIPAGTGRYQFIIDEDNVPYLLSFAGWWKNEPSPITRIELIAIESGEDLVFNFQNDLLSLVSLDAFAPISPRLHSGYERWDYPTPTMMYVGINTHRVPLDNPLVRQVLYKAVDRDRLTTETYGSYAQAAYMPVPPASKLYNADLAEQHLFRAGGAAELLDELAFSDNDGDGILEYKTGRNRTSPFTLDIIVNDENTQRVSLAEQYASALNLLGIQAQVRTLGWTQYQMELNAGNFDIYFAETVLTADFSLDPLLLSGGALNFGLYHGAETESIISEVKAGTVGINELYKKLLDDVPFIPVCFRSHTLYAQRGLLSQPTPSWRNVFHNFSSWKINPAEGSAE